MDSSSPTLDHSKRGMPYLCTKHLDKRGDGHSARPGSTDAVSHSADATSALRTGPLPAITLSESGVSTQAHITFGPPSNHSGENEIESSGTMLLLAATTTTTISDVVYGDALHHDPGRTTVSTAEKISSGRPRRSRTDPSVLGRRRDPVPVLSPPPGRARVSEQFRRFSTSVSRTFRRNAQDEPFIPIDPFNLHFVSRLSNILSKNKAEAGQTRTDATPLTDTFYRFLYLNFLLHFPALYFTRVARVIEDAEISRNDFQRMQEMQQMVDATMVDATLLTSEPLSMDFPSPDAPSISTRVPVGDQNSSEPGIHTHRNASLLSSPDRTARQITGTIDDSPVLSPALRRFKKSWEEFIDSLLREWKTLNVVAVLMLSALLTMMQVPDAEQDPLTRFAALLSLVCSLMSLSYGCMYTVRFGTMRSLERASRWAEEAARSNTSILWNVWVLLAMPFVWLSWSVILFVVSILAFVWRTGFGKDPSAPTGVSKGAALASRLIITGFFILGIVYFFLMIRTLRTYGSLNSWQMRWGKGLRARPRQAQAETNVRDRGAGQMEEGGIQHVISPVSNVLHSPQPSIGT